MMSIERLRKKTIVEKTIAKFNLDLSGLTVFTEAATNNYQYTPIISAVAGAQRVFAITRGSKYGNKEDIRRDTMELAKQFGVEDRIEVIFEKDSKAIRSSDIITNSGFVRPIDRAMISQMKSTAVIPLMWETWEYRKSELDLDVCREKGILVLGTDEHNPLLNLFHSNGFLICKLLFDKGMGVYKDNLLLISSGLIGDSAADFFINNNIQFKRIVFDDNVPENKKPYLLNENQIEEEISNFDAIIIAEHHHNVDILSQSGLINPNILKEKNPTVQIIHICGAVNKEDMLNAGLSFYPNDIAPFGYMTISPDYLGSKTVFELITAGLKVGEVMARCRLNGMSIRETIAYTLENAPAMDFPDSSGG